MTKPHKHAALIKAWAEGAKIETFGTSRGVWFDVTESPAWSPDSLYRIKPEPKADVEMYSRITLGSNPQLEAEYSPAWHNVKYTFDGETGKLKSIKLIG